jgi:hypothetical protein
VRIVAIAPDMMDRSRLSAAVARIEFATAADACAGADIVLVDIGRRAADVAKVRAVTATARIVAFGPHVDDAGFEAARRDGADVVVPRSRFFRDIPGALA